MEREKEQMVHDYEEYEGNLDKMAQEMKDQDYDFMEVLDENEEIENQYEELASEYRKTELVISQQTEKIEFLESENQELRTLIDERDQLIKVKEEHIVQLNQRGKKRNREEFEGTSTTQVLLVPSATSNGNERKKFKLNPIASAESAAGTGSAQSC